MKDQVTSIEQSKRLLELGVPAEKASMSWVKDPNDNEYSLCVHDECCYEVAALEPVPAFTVADLLGMMPRELPNPTLGGHMARLAIDFIPDKVGICYLTGSYVILGGHQAVGSDIQTALIEEIEWLVFNGYRSNL